jgi:transposase InsO family protein
LQHLFEAVLYQAHTVLTDNIQFAEQPRNWNTIHSRPTRFDMICEANGIEHRLNKPNHPCTNGQVERMNRTIKEATVKRFHYDSHDQARDLARRGDRAMLTLLRSLIRRKRARSGPGTDAANQAASISMVLATAFLCLEIRPWMAT